MNQIEGALKYAMSRASKEAFDLDYSEEQVIIEIPKDKSHGDYACNSSRFCRCKNPRQNTTNNHHRDQKRWDSLHKSFQKAFAANSIKYLWKLVLSYIHPHNNTICNSNQDARENPRQK